MNNYVESQTLHYINKANKNFMFPPKLYRSSSLAKGYDLAPSQHYTFYALQI